MFTDQYYEKISKNNCSDNPKALNFAENSLTSFDTYGFFGKSQRKHII
jgi:hypothetical protein